MDEGQSLGYEFQREEDARNLAAELDRRFSARELKGLRIHRVVWNANFIVEAVFAADTPASRLQDARALLGEAGTPVHPDDLQDYKRATRERAAGNVPRWLRRFLGE